MVVLSNYSEEDKEKWDMELRDLNSKVSLQTVSFFPSFYFEY